jgi:multiple antibiotic resistance protein
VGDDHAIAFGLEALVTLLVVVDPLAAVPAFVAITSDRTEADRRGIVNRAPIAAAGVSLFFLIAGRALLDAIGVGVDAFAISGGVLLFATAVPMLFGSRPGLQGPRDREQGTTGEDPAIFPLAIPLLSGPGAITTILLLRDRADGDVARLALLIVATVTVYVVTWTALRAGESLVLRIGEGKLHIVTRVLGIVLAALAVQYVLDGLAGAIAKFPRAVT